MKSDSVAPISKEAIREARANFVRNDDNAEAWAIRNGYSPRLVRMVLGGRRRCLRGLSREIADKLKLRADSKHSSSPAGRTLAGVGPVANCDRVDKLQSLGEPVA